MSPVEVTWASRLQQWSRVGLLNKVLFTSCFPQQREQLPRFPSLLLNARPELRKGCKKMGGKLKPYSQLKSMGSFAFTVSWVQWVQAIADTQKVKY